MKHLIALSMLLSSQVFAHTVCDTQQVVNYDRYGREYLTTEQYCYENHQHDNHAGLFFIGAVTGIVLQNQFHSNHREHYYPRPYQYQRGRHPIQYHRGHDFYRGHDLHR